ncbi:MAG: RlmE family RNA methyltransferase [Spirochaetota bacterium]
MRGKHTSGYGPDHYTLRARKAGYPARSVFKLEEIQQKHRLLKPGFKVLDIGAAPGSWSLYALSLVTPKGMVAAVDLSPMDIGDRENFFLFKGDIFKQDAASWIAARGPFNVILSDAAPATTGNRGVDTARSAALAECVITLAEESLVKAGNLVIKVFQGGASRQLLNRMKGAFKTVKAFKPQASRRNSFEIYFIGLSKLQEFRI